MITDQGGFCITSNFSELFPLRNEQLGKISELHLNTGSRKDAISTFDIRNQYLTAISVKVVSHLAEFVTLQLDIPSGHVFSTVQKFFFCIIFSI